MSKSLSWVISSQSKRIHLDDFIAMTDDFNFAGYKLGSEKSALFSLKVCPYKIFSKQKNILNNIHPDTLKGSGEISKKDGFLPIVYFAVFNKRHILRTQEVAVTFADENGNEVELFDFEDLKTQLQRMEVFTDEVRPLLETLGYVEKFYNLNDIDTDSAHSYF